MTETNKTPNLNDTSDSDFISKNLTDGYPILSLINDPALVIDLSGYIKTANEAGLFLFAQSIKNQHSLFNLFDKESRKRLRSFLDDVSIGEISVLNRIPGMFHDGEPFLADFHCLKDGVDFIITIHLNHDFDSDLSENFGEGDNKYKLLEAIPAPVFCKNSNHIYIACNEEFLKFLGLSREEVIGRGVFDVAPSKNAKVYKEADDKLFREKGKQVYETEVLYADGTMHDVVFHKSVFDDDAGNAAGIIGIILDITSRKKAERRAQESESLFQAIVKNCPAYIFIKNLEGEYIVSGDKFTSKVGWPKGHLLGKTDYEIFPNEVATTLRNNDQEVIKAGKAISEKESFWLDDTEITNIAVKFPLFDSQGQITGVAGIATDISELIDAENKLKEASKKLEQQVQERTSELSEEIKIRQQTEQQLQQVLSSSPVGAGIAERNSGVITFCNERLIELLAPDQQSLLGQHVQTFWVNADQQKSYLEGLNREGDVELKEALMLRKNHAPFWANVFGRLITHPSGDHVVFWVFDLSQIKHDQEKIRKSENELRNTLSASPVAVCISEKKSGALSFANESICDLLGATQEELIGKSTLQYWGSKADRDIIVEEFKKTGAAGPHDIEIVRVDGERKWVSLSWTKLTIEGEDKIVSWIYDISQIKEAETMLKSSHGQLEKRVAKRTIELENEIADRKKIEEALRESEAQFEASANSASDWFWGMDENFRFNSFSERMEETIGIKQQELLGLPGWKVLKTNLTKEQWVQYKSELVNHRPFRDFKFEIVKKDHSKLPISISGIPIFDDGGLFKGYRGAGRDISQELIAEQEAKKLEQQLHQSQKMEAIGQLTGGVAHDFNNILAIILGNLDLVNDELAEDSSLHSFMKAIEGSATRGAQLTQRLLAYSRKQALHPQRANLDDLANGILELIERLLSSAITIHYKNTENLRPIFADPSQIENSLMNLCINASDAMPNGGDLYIETGNLTVTDKEASDYADLKAGLYSWLSVRDTGYGMDETTLEHAFEPFFTTKEVGKGTGLGLSMIYGFAKQSNGTVLIESKPGNGTLATLLLPSLLD